MTTTVLRKELHKAIDEMPDSNFLQAVVAMFKEYRNAKVFEFELSDEDKAILDEEKRLHKAGKTKSYTVAEVRKHAYSRLKK